MFKVGDKVTPLRKTVYGSLENCKYWKKAQVNGQKYLIVNEVYDDGEIACDDVGNVQYGSVYRESDLILYVEEQKEEEVYTVTLDMLIELQKVGILKGSDTFIIRRA